MQISPLGCSVRTVDPHWGKWHNSSANFNPNHNVNSASKQASIQTTNITVCNVPVSLQICKIKNQKEWYWPPNIKEICKV
jgi:hypothetical protein